MKYMYFSLDKHCSIQVLQLQLSFAFDSISHDTTINRLSLIGISGDSLKILSLLIKDRNY